MLHIFKNIIELPKKFVQNYSRLSNISRTFFTSVKTLGNYEGDGRTTVSILNREYKHLVMVDTISDIGFRLNNGIFVVGPLAVFPRSILQWNVNNAEEMTKESLSLFCLLEPKLDILVIGTGNYKVLPNADVLQYLKSNKIHAEILPTFDAVSILNFLNSEGRCVAGALIPPTNVAHYEDETQILGTVEMLEDYSTKSDNKIIR